MATYTATVNRVVDGDTIIADGQRIRLANINTAEKGMAGGLAATHYLRNLIEDQEVKIESKGTDSFGRTLAWVWRVSDGLPVNKSIVDAGHSRWIN